VYGTLAGARRVATMNERKHHATTTEPRTDADSMSLLLLPQTDRERERKRGVADKSERRTGGRTDGRTERYSFCNLYDNAVT